MVGEGYYLISESMLVSVMNRVLDEREKRPKNRRVLRGLSEIATWYRTGQKTASNWLKMPSLKQLVMRTSGKGMIFVYEDEFSQALKELNLKN